MVTIKNGKLHKANEGDYIIGITSGAPAVIGNVDTEYFWKYKKMTLIGWSTKILKLQ
jgi:hypothetical protein